MLHYITIDMFKQGVYLESGGGEADQIGVVGGKRKLLCLGVRVCECDSLQRDTKHYERVSTRSFQFTKLHQQANARGYKM